MSTFRKRNNGRFFVLLASTNLFLATPSALADSDRYFVILFGIQSQIHRQPRAHCMATFVRVHESDLPTTKVTLEQHTISWYPETEHRFILTPPERGINRTLEESLNIAVDKKLRVEMHGPFEIQAPLFEKAVAQKEWLESGAVLWKALDLTTRPKGYAINCVHAVSDVDTDERYCGGPTWGILAGRQIVTHFKRWMICPEKTHPWVAESLGLCRYGLEHNKRRVARLR